MTMTKQTVRFVSPTGSLDVLARIGKNGISVFVRVKPTGQRAVIGCRNVFLAQNEKAAQEKFDALVAEAEKAWTRKASSGAGVTASRFDAIPAPNALPASVALTAKPAKEEKPAKPVAVPAAKTAGGKK